MHHCFPVSPDSWWKKPPLLIIQTTPGSDSVTTRYNRVSSPKMTTNWSFMAGTAASRNLHCITQKHKTCEIITEQLKGRERCHERCSGLSSWAALCSPQAAAGPAEAAAPPARTPSPLHCTVAPPTSSPILPNPPAGDLHFA